MLKHTVHKEQIHSRNTSPNKLGEVLYCYLDELIRTWNVEPLPFPGEVAQISPS